MFGAVQDITERKRADDRQHLLNEELSHRLKNTLSLVQAIASQTLRAASDRAAVRSFEQRIAALSRAHDVLMQNSWNSADMRAALTKVLELHGEPGQFEFSGPDVKLGDKAVLSLSLLVHELATNAQKYGALSVPEGRVDVAWSVQGGDLVVNWREHNGPAVQEPRAKGLGSRLIDMGLAGTGGVVRRYDPSGLSVRFSAPLALVEQGGK